ncbi:MAG TPA: alpha-2-macroglobulin family protein, partial [Chitinophaga sp.]
KNVSYYNSTISLRKGEQVIDLDESTFPAGIAQFTVYSGNSLPLAERLCFLNGNSTLHALVSTDKPKYQPREKVTMTLKTVDDKGIPVPANFSLAVVDDKLWSLADDKQDNIMSWLLMSSELQGKIEEPQFYFKKNEEKASIALDLVMLTHGYRYFDFVPAVQKEHKLLFVPNQDNVLSGIILNSKGRPVKADVYLVEGSGLNLKAVQMQTGDDGGFFFTGVMPYTNYLLIAKSLKKAEKVRISILENSSAISALSGRQLGQAGAIAPGTPASQAPEATDDEGKTDGTLQGLFNGLDGDKGLSEVVVVAYGAEKKELTWGATSVKSYDFPAPNTMQAILNGRAAGIAITQEANSFANGPIVLRGSRSLSGDNMPLIIVDGIPVGKGEINISPDEVLSITVLKDASATALYGSRGAYGVIVITTKQRGLNSIRVNLAAKSYYTAAFVPARGNPYAVARKFYAPQYHSTIAYERNDFRETIYWNPVVQTDKKGEAKVEFYNSDATTTFRAIAEGIGYNGKVGRAETTYVAQNTISVDVKIPPYLTVGDKALVPLVVENNSSERRLLSIRAELPAGLKAGSYVPEITLSPDSAGQVLIPIEVTAAIKGKVRITTGTDAYKETLTLPVETGAKGFPIVHTFSGNRSAEHHFTMSRVVPGTLKAELKIYKDIAGRFADDIAAMLRAPYGCFEQTSSTTYPNIFILKYLKETGRSNPAIEKKALDYLEAGYKRLISFETSENGFEWFGHTPAHEPLTAYGLLEFTDMQEFVKVDKAMLQRTKEFLLKRRDGKGGFSISPGAYHFHAIPANVANIYIVYAMTQAGYGNEIQREYKASVEKALTGDDGYELSLAALSASNMKDKESFTKLMERLSDWYGKNDFKSGASIMGSGGTSLKVELLSLYALALMREEPFKTGLVADIICKILEARSFCGYGSTQSTLLALNALVQYSKMVTGAFASKIDFTLDSVAVVPEGDLIDNLKEGKHAFTVQYKNGEDAIPYKFEVSYQTFTPPNSPEAVMKLATSLSTARAKVGETVRMEVSVKNEKAAAQAMTIAMIGIPAGLTAQPWQLKELTEKNQVAYYEIFDNYLVLYWRGFEPNESKKINLDLKAEIPGTYKGKAGNAYLYYTPEYKHWNEGLEVEILP